MVCDRSGVQGAGRPLLKSQKSWREAPFRPLFVTLSCDGPDDEKEQTERRTNDGLWDRNFSLNAGVRFR